MALQIKSFDPQKFKLNAGIKKCHFGKFPDRAGMAVPCWFGPQESLTGFQKIFLFWVPSNAGRQNQSKPIFLGFNIVKKRCGWSVLQQQHQNHLLAPVIRNNPNHFHSKGSLAASLSKSCPMFSHSCKKNLMISKP